MSDITNHKTENYRDRTPDCPDPETLPRSGQPRTFSERYRKPAQSLPAERRMGMSYGALGTLSTQ